MAWTPEQYEAYQRERGQVAFKEAQTTKPSKFRNVKVEVDGEKFDSKREAAYWHELKLREKAGEIRNVRRQVPFPLYTPSFADGVNCEDSTLIVDFVYFDNDEVGAEHVVDVKGCEVTPMFASKAKRLFLQQGIEVEIIR
jgi:hypothetical protein